VGSGKLELGLMAGVFEERPALAVEELFVTLCHNLRVNWRGRLPDRVCEGARENTCKYIKQSVVMRAKVPYFAFSGRCAAALVRYTVVLTSLQKLQHVALPRRIVVCHKFENKAESKSLWVQKERGDLDEYTRHASGSANYSGVPT
jgi:hypothetical protein